MSEQRSPGGHESSPEVVDLLIVGGGINGAGIARDAAGRGLRVLLCEKGDLSQGTSSRSSRLIHGGLRYLEHGEFRLVREALQEREILLAMAPHLVRPLRFVLPHVAGMRPAWVLRLGLFLYDHLARRGRLPASRTVMLRDLPEGAAVRPQCKRAFLYSDCRTDDARLVVLNALSAHELGAQVRTHCEFVRAAACEGRWRVQLRDADSGTLSSVEARALINAAGPWVEQVGSGIAGAQRRHRARLVKGSHLVVPKFWQGEQAFLLQNVDGRAIFVTPYEESFAMIGTTDIAYAQDPGEVAISSEETDYLLTAVNRQLRCALGPADVVHAYSGVRSLVDDESADPSAVTRDYVLEAAHADPRTPVLTIFGGKITTYRRLAEHALELLQTHFPQMRPPWTASTPLPGGDFPDADFASARSQYLRQTPFLPQDHACGLFDRHGTIARRILGSARQAVDLGRHFGAGLYECELDYLVQKEWARTPEDVLWRRTKFGLRLTATERAVVARSMNSA